MAVVVTTFGADYYARVILGIEPVQGYSVHLWVNFRTPQVNDSWPIYTECTWPGYSPFSLNPAEWTGGAQNGVATYSYPLLTFNFDASDDPQQTIYGYAVLSSDGTLLYLESFSAPFPIPPEGGSIPMVLHWTDEQCTD